MSVVEFGFTVSAVVAVEYVILGGDGIGSKTACILLAARHVLIEKPAVVYAANMPFEPTHAPEIVVTLFKRDNLYKLRKLAYVYVDKHRALCVEPNVKVIVSVLFVKARLPIGEVCRHSTVQILLCLCYANALIRQIEMRFDILICKPKPIRVYATA